MKKLLLCMTPFVLIGCAGSNSQYQSIGNTPPLPTMYTGRLPEPNQAMEIDPHIRPMSRNEVVTAIQECESAGTRAVMIYGKRKVNNYTTDLVVDVTCAPRMRLPIAVN